MLLLTAQATVVHIASSVQFERGHLALVVNFQARREQTKEQGVEIGP